MSPPRARATSSLFLLALAVLLAPGAAGLPQAEEVEPAREARAPSGIEAEGLDGRLWHLEPDALPLSDPRTIGAWFLRPVGVRASSAPTDEALAEVRVGGGDVLRGRVAGGSGERLSLELLGGVVLPVPVDDLRSVVFPARVPVGGGEALGGPTEGDRLYRRSGRSLDPIDGTLTGFSGEGVGFESVIGRRTFPWSEVAALFVEALGEPDAAPPDGTPVSVDLVDGGRLRGTLARLDGRTCRITLAGGLELDLDLANVLEVAVADGSLVALSELPPASEVGRGAPFGDELGMIWPHRMDRAVDGGPLVSGGRSYSRGIGTHAPTAVTWRLDGSYVELRGLIGIDDAVLRNPEGARGSVVFRVRADGETLWESPVVRGGEAPRPLPPVSLEGVRELVLEADPAGGFAGDRADWLRMVLRRGP